MNPTKTSEASHAAPLTEAGAPQDQEQLFDLELPARVAELDQTVRNATPTLCAERALLVTRYFRRTSDKDSPMVVRKAEALAYVLRQRQTRIYPQELLVGGYTSHRVGGGLFPELHGLVMLEDLLAFDKRPVNPFALSSSDRRRLLLEVLPYWLPRCLPARMGAPVDSLKLVLDQLSPTFSLINETAGISHVVPDYAQLLAVGTEGYRQRATARMAQVPAGSSAAQFCRAVQIVCDGLEAFADGYRQAAERMARAEEDAHRRRELETIAAVCRRVPRHPARSLHEALQALLLLQIALYVESLDSSVSPGRLDQVLLPYYQRDVQQGRLDPAGALELLGCFAVKLCEHLPVYSRRVTRFHGGMNSGQVVIVGGTDREGRDATNELTWLLLGLMNKLHTRQPNYHARLHPGSPPAYRARVAATLTGGGGSPAVYNDAVIVPLLCSRGIEERDARDYANVGCVEPVAAGRSFLSTDAALFNLPICLELALGEGRRFGRWRREGLRTPPGQRCGSTDELIELFRQQLEHAIDRLLRDLAVIERANARLHPTPLTSMLLSGCLENARDATEGGATYNGSGVQGVGIGEVGDSLAAIEEVVFVQRAATLAQVIEACRADFAGHEPLRARLLRAPRFGNDDPRADRYVGRVMELFADCLARGRNTRGGAYAAGFYSVTAHRAFGEKVGALPSGRRRGEPFSSGLSAAAGADRRGPTATLMSQASLPLSRAANGVNFNLALAPWVGEAQAGERYVQALLDGAFAAGCMQLQLNVLDPSLLIEARDNPALHPGLLVRVSGYSAYFNDLSDEMKQEIIDRTLHEMG